MKQERPHVRREQNPELANDKNKIFMKKRWAQICQKMAIFFVGFIVIIGLIGIVLPDKSFSEQENRNLQKLPMISVSGIMDKSWMDDIESYTSDQFPARDMWVSAKTSVDLMLGKKQLNNVYLSKNKYLIQIPSEPNEEAVQNNIEAINQFASAHSGLTTNMMLVPNAAYTLSDKLPIGAIVRDQKADLDWVNSLLAYNVNRIDVFTALSKHADEEIYYHTDHHWTTLGAYYGYAEWAKSTGQAVVYKDYKVHTVTDDFEGTLASNSGYHRVKDTIEVYENTADATSYLVTDSDNEEKRTSVYDIDALDTKSKYEVFFGGNHATVNIQTVNTSDKNLLVFKDSYANAFVPFLIPYYNTIIMVDPRYYYDNIDTVIDNYGITDVLFLYNLDTFLGDNSIADVLSTDSGSTGI